MEFALVELEVAKFEKAVRAVTGSVELDSLMTSPATASPMSGGLLCALGFPVRVWRAPRFDFARER